MLEKAGHRVVRYEKSNADIRENGIFRKIPLALRTIWNWRTFAEVRRIVRDEKPDVVHCHNTFPAISPSVYWAAALEGVPVVQTLHNYRLACLNGYFFRNGRICEKCLGKVPWRGVCLGCYRSSRLQSAAVAAMLVFHRAIGTWRNKVCRYVALTDFAKSKFAAAGIPAGKIVVKPNAFVPQESGTGASGSGAECGGFRLQATAASPVVLYLGRLSAEKGPDVLVAAWRLLRGKSGDGPAKRATLVLAGDGPERKALEEAAAGLQDVEFLGQVPKNGVSALLARASALVLPSRCHEQFSTTVMEAMSHGVPAVVSRSAVHGTLVCDGVSGLHFDSGDPSSLAQALENLLSDPKRLSRMGEAAREAFLESDCVPSRNVAKLVEIYRGCAKGACPAN